jgi:hypothetical protein
MVEPFGSARLISPVCLRASRDPGNRISSSERNWSMSSSGTWTWAGWRSADRDLEDVRCEKECWTELHARARGLDGFELEAL